MPQVFIVVRCFDCDTFQVQQSKKSPRWSCKMCGQKQSLKKGQETNWLMKNPIPVSVEELKRQVCTNRSLSCSQDHHLTSSSDGCTVYGKGSGADCRKLVQSLNLTAGELMESRKTSSNMQPDEDESTPHEYFQEEVIRDCSESTSRWTNFLEEPEWTGFEDSNRDSEEHFNVVTERPHPIKRQQDMVSFNKKQRFPNKSSHWQSSSCTSKNFDSKKLHQQELPSLSSASPYLSDVDNFGGGNDSRSSSRSNSITIISEDNTTNHLETKANKCYASQLFVRTNLKNGVLQEKIPQQTNVSIHQQSPPMKKRRKHETEVPKQTSVNARGNNSKWSMFLTAETDDSKDEEKHLSEDFVEPECLKGDGTIRLDKFSRPKIFQIDDALEDEFSWYD